jgi:hypothetical protein
MVAADEPYPSRLMRGRLLEQFCSDLELPAPKRNLSDTNDLLERTKSLKQEAQLLPKISTTCLGPLPKLQISLTMLCQMAAEDFAAGGVVDRFRARLVGDLDRYHEQQLKSARLSAAAAMLAFLEVAEADEDPDAQRKRLEQLSRETLEVIADSAEAGIRSGHSSAKPSKQQLQNWINWLKSEEAPAELERSGVVNA